MLLVGYEDKDLGVVIKVTCIALGREQMKREMKNRWRIMTEKWQARWRRKIRNEKEECGLHL